VISNIETMQRHSQAVIAHFEETDRPEENPIHQKVCFLNWIWADGNASFHILFGRGKRLPFKFGEQQFLVSWNFAE
jgi:hypothetical protein